MIETESAFKRKILDLVEEDREFRLTLGALIGFKELLEKLETHDCKFNAILERLDRHEARFEEYNRKFNAILERLDRHEARFEEQSGRIEALATEIKSLRIDFNAGMRAFQLRLDALGARWGIFAEEAFREGVKGIVAKYFGGEVRRWVHEDEAGEVFGHPASVEVDLLIRDTEQVLVEVKSSVSRGDLATLLRKGKLYEQVEGVKPLLAIVSPYVEEEAVADARALGIALFTRLV
jgi:hypothetical protein